MATKVNRALLLTLVGGLSSVPLGLFFFGPAPILAVGFIFGTPYPPISAAVAGLAVLTWMGGIGALSYLALTGIPSALAIQLSISNNGSSSEINISRAITAVSTFGLCVILFLSVDLFGLGSRTENYIEISFENFFDQFQKQIHIVTDPQQAATASLAFNALGKFAAKISVGSLGAASFLILAVNVAFIETLTHKLGQSKLIRADYSLTQPPAWLSLVYFGMIGLSFLAEDIGKFGLNCAIFLSFPFILIGLAVIHTIARSCSNEKAALLVFYILVFVLGFILGLVAFIAIILTMVGAFECWFKVRQRVSKSSPD